MARQKYTLDPALTFEAAKAIADKLWTDSGLADRTLNAFIDAQGPRGPMNLTPDRVKAMPEYQRLKNLNELAFQQLRNYNAVYVKKFKKELSRDIQARREAKLKASQEKAANE